MKDYLHTIQNVHQSLDNLLVKSQNSSEIKQLTEPFSDSLQPCFEEIKQSSTKLKSLVEDLFTRIRRCKFKYGIINLCF
jgi:hypothetical protein